MFFNRGTHTLGPQGNRSSQRVLVQWWWWRRKDGICLYQCGLHQLTDESEACAMASCHVMRTIEIKFSAALNNVSSERWQSQQTSMYRYVNQQISSWKNEDMLYALYHMSIESILFVWKIEQQTLCTIHWNNKCSLMSCCKLEYLYFLKQVDYMHLFLFKEVLNSHLEWIGSNESLYQKEPRNFF